MIDNNDNSEHKLLTSLLKYNIRIILAISIIMCTLLITIDSLNIVSDEDMWREREIAQRYTDANMIVFENFISEYEYIIEDASKKIGKELATTNEVESKQIELLLEDLSNRYKSTSAAYIGTQSKKMLLMPKLRLPDDYDPSERAWYKSAEANGMTWSDLYLDAFTGEYIITISTPIHNANTGQLLGVVGLDIKINELLNKVEDWHISESDYYTIIDSNGIVLYHPNREIVGTEVVIEELKSFVLRGDNGSTEYEFNGQKKVADILSFEALNMSFVHIDDIVEKHIKQFDFVIIIIMLFGMLFMIALITNKTKKVRYELDNSNTKSDIDLNSKAISKESIREISSQLKNVTSKLDEFI